MTIAKTISLHVLLMSTQTTASQAWCKCMDVVIKAAQKGDLVACKLVLDRIYPALKPSANSIEITQGSTITETSHNVIASTLSGNIAPDSAALLINALASQSKIIEVDELMQRVETLENAANSKTD